MAIWKGGMFLDSGMVRSGARYRSVRTGQALVVYKRENAGQWWSIFCLNLSVIWVHEVKLKLIHCGQSRGSAVKFWFHLDMDWSIRPLRAECMVGAPTWAEAPPNLNQILIRVYKAVINGETKGWCGSVSGSPALKIQQTIKTHH